MSRAVLTALVWVSSGAAAFGQGAFPNNEQLIALLTAGNQLGIKISLSHGPTHYPAGYSTDDDHARKTLVFGKATVDAGQTFELDRSSVIDLTSTVAGKNTAGVLGGTTAGSIRWTAPAGAPWQLIVFWSRGVSAQPDPFSEEGHNQIINSMETGLSPEVKKLMQIDGGDAVDNYLPMASANHMTGNPWYSTECCAARTAKAPVELDLKGLTPWPEIPALKNASGIGAYTTTINLPAGWTRGQGATLSLGEVFDTFTLTVNGKAVPVDQIGAQADLGPYLKAGQNTLAVRVATTLNNRLAALDETVKRPSGRSQRGRPPE